MMATCTTRMTNTFSLQDANRDSEETTMRLRLAEALARHKQMLAAEETEDVLGFGRLQYSLSQETVSKTATKASPSKEPAGNRWTSQQLMSYITKILKRDNEDFVDGNSSDKLSAVTPLARMFYTNCSRHQVKIYDPVFGEIVKDISLKELLDDVAEKENPWEVLKLYAEQWARGRAAMLRSATHAEFEKLMQQLEELQQEEEDDVVESEVKRVKCRKRFQSGQRAAVRRFELLEAKKAQKAMLLQKAAVNAKKMQLKKKSLVTQSADPEDRNTLIDKAAAEQLADMEKLLRSLEQKAAHKALAAIASKKEELEEESEADCRQARPARDDSRTQEGRKPTTSANRHFNQNKPLSIDEDRDPYGGDLASSSCNGAMHFHLGSEARPDGYIAPAPDIVQRAVKESNAWKSGQTAAVLDQYAGGHAGAAANPNRTDMESLGKPLHRASAPVEMVEFAFNGGDLRRGPGLRAEKSEPVLPSSRKPMKKWMHERPESPSWVPRAHFEEAATAGPAWKFALDGDHVGSQDLGPYLQEKRANGGEAASREPWRASTVANHRQSSEFLVYDPNGARDDLELPNMRPRASKRDCRRSRSMGPMDTVEGLIEDDSQPHYNPVHSVQTDRPRRNRFVNSMKDHIKRFAATCQQTATEGNLEHVRRHLVLQGKAMSAFKLSDSLLHFGHGVDQGVERLDKHGNVVADEMNGYDGADTGFLLVAAVHQALLNDEEVTKGVASVMIDELVQNLNIKYSVEGVEEEVLDVGIREHGLLGSGFKIAIEDGDVVAARVVLVGSELDGG
ncbi:hypothetical protein CYMTET_29143 [Cymbomonas tetramitiformis]|uniref:Uncharacterized protein n=1 Tax=Cymbomonas tetramitiformis TaxID=36881 RepID=A0AAE0FN26_9CHLO|nr:hypothetical protein CYMTET_29143 [Cymbomonas tetramitiformis]